MEVKTYFCSLSEAIREGAKSTPAASSRGVFMDEFGGTCALGAGCFAIGLPLVRNGTGLWGELEDLYPYLLDDADHPLLGRRDQVQVEYVVAGLFDGGWTRELVAQWLEEVVEEKLGYVTVSDEGFKTKNPVLEASAHSTDRVTQYQGA